jgi:hypothetical protein
LLKYGVYPSLYDIVFYSPRHILHEFI